MTDSRVPTGAIEWIVDRMHVGVSEDDIRADIARRFAAGATPPDAALLAACQDYAVQVHRDNRALYRTVTGSM